MVDRRLARAKFVARPIRLPAQGNCLKTTLGNTANPIALGSHSSIGSCRHFASEDAGTCPLCVLERGKDVVSGGACAIASFLLPWSAHGLIEKLIPRDTSPGKLKLMSGFGHPVRVRLVKLFFRFFNIRCG